MLQKGESLQALVDAQPDAALKPKVVEYTSIIQDLFNRQPELTMRLLEELKDVPSIKKASAQLNLDYEYNKPETVKVSCAQPMYTIAALHQ
jgi:hypothetical protein